MSDSSFTVAPNTSRPLNESIARRIQIIPFTEKGDPIQTTPLTSLEKLLILLKAIDEDPLQEDNYDKILQNSLAEGLATDALIDERGHCLWENHEILKEAGFSVFPGERDRFGWLTGCIQTKKGIIVYG